MSGPRPDRPGPRKASPGRLLVSKVLVMLALTCAVAYNCRSPSLLDAAAGDASKEPAVQLPFATSKRKIVGHLHLSLGLPTFAACAAALAAWFCLAPGTPARQPWRGSEAAAAIAVAAGAGLRAWCFRELGRLFTYEVGIRQVQCQDAVGLQPNWMLSWRPTRSRPRPHCLCCCCRATP